MSLEDRDREEREWEGKGEDSISIHGRVQCTKHHTIQERVTEAIVTLRTVIFQGIGIVLLSSEDDNKRIEQNLLMC